MHLGNSIMALVGLLPSTIGISAIMHFSNDGLLNRKEFYLYWCSVTSFFHVFMIIHILKYVFSASVIKEAVRGHFHFNGMTTIYLLFL